MRSITIKTVFEMLSESVNLGPSIAIPTWTEVFLKAPRLEETITEAQQVTLLDRSTSTTKFELSLKLPAELRLKILGEPFL